MLLSYDWLQSHFSDNLPSPEKLGELFTFHAFEVEAINPVGEKSGGMVEDTVIDVKILPDRAHYCLCHKGVASEVAALTGVARTHSAPDPVVEKELASLSIHVQESRLCRRYIGRRVEGVSVGQAPLWMKKRLAAIGQRSINAVVDAANYAMFDVGQPLHAFDADKISGNITVRFAKEGERITTLDGKDVAVGPSAAGVPVLLIADNEGPLAIAGIKGGRRAEVTADTKNLILESANFDPVLIRKTSQKLGIKTDASKRFENELAEEVAMLGMDALSALIDECCGAASGASQPLVFGMKEDAYPAPRPEWHITLTAKDVSSVLGFDVSAEEIMKACSKLGIDADLAGSQLTLTPPFERLDLATPEDIAEEVGRLIGYDKIAAVPLPKPSHPPHANRHFVASSAIRKHLASAGFSEHYGYAFTDKGDVALANPLASDKSHLRTDLSRGMEDRLRFNMPFPLFDTDSVRLFEIGTAFWNEKNAAKGEAAATGAIEPREEIRVCIGVGSRQKKGNKSAEDVARFVSEIVALFSSIMPESAVKKVSRDGLAVAEFSLDALIGEGSLPEMPDLSAYCSPAKFQAFSAFPRIVRDVALFVPPSTDASEPQKIIAANAGPLVAEGPVLFDVFEKKAADGSVEKRSLAYRMSFQSFDRTLSDDEINAVMNVIVAALEKKGWEVRSK